MECKTCHGEALRGSKYCEGCWWEARINGKTQSLIDEDRREVKAGVELQEWLKREYGVTSALAEMLGELNNK